MEPQKKVEHKVVQTYAEDMAGVLENDNQGLIKRIIHEGEEQEQQKKDLSPESQKNKIFLYVSIGLMISALLLLSFLSISKKDTSIPVEKQFTPLVFSDKSVFFEVSQFKKEEIIQTVLNEINKTSIQPGELEGIYLTENKQIVGLRRFSALIKSNFLPNDNTAIVNDNFLMGVVNSDTLPAQTGKGFFILLKTRSSTDIFDSLRSWEEKMFLDLRGFLGINTGGETKYLLTKSFEDGIIENKNARILHDQDGNIVLMYIFADDNSIVITNTQATAHEIMLRLASSEKKQ